MRTGLAEAWWSRVCDQVEESAATNLGQARHGDGQYAEAEWIHCEKLVVEKRVLGEEHPDTLRTASNLASSLSSQGKYARAKRIKREVLGVRRRVLGEEHPETLMSAANLAVTLSSMLRRSGSSGMLRQSGSIGTCLVWRDEYLERSIRTHLRVRPIKRCCSAIK
jgi:hypothetical protein